MTPVTAHHDVALEQLSRLQHHVEPVRLAGVNTAEVETNTQTHRHTHVACRSVTP